MHGSMPRPSTACTRSRVNGSGDRNGVHATHRPSVSVSETFATPALEASEAQPPVLSVVVGWGGWRRVAIDAAKCREVILCIFEVRARRPKSDIVCGGPCVYMYRALRLSKR